MVSRQRPPGWPCLVHFLATLECKQYTDFFHAESWAQQLMPSFEAAGAVPLHTHRLCVSDVHDPPHHWMKPVCFADCCIGTRNHRFRMHRGLTNALLCAAADSSRRFLLQSGEQLELKHCLSQKVLHACGGRSPSWWLMQFAPSCRVSLHHIAAMYCFWRSGPNLTADFLAFQLLASTHVAMSAASILCGKQDWVAGVGHCLASVSQVVGK